MSERICKECGILFEQQDKEAVCPRCVVWELEQETASLKEELRRFKSERTRIRTPGGRSLYIDFPPRVRLKEVEYLRHWLLKFCTQLS